MTGPIEELVLAEDQAIPFSLRDAESGLGEALVPDPALAAAHEGFAVCTFLQIVHGFTTDTDTSRAELFEAASRAVDLDPRDALACHEAPLVIPAPEAERQYTINSVTSSCAE
jgi:hypothetical protein